MALATGVACRRCGGALQAEDAHQDRGKRKREPAPAVRPSATSHVRRSSGSEQDDVV